MPNPCEIIEDLGNATSTISGFRLTATYSSQGDGTESVTWRHSGTCSELVNASETVTARNALVCTGVANATSSGTASAKVHESLLDSASLSSAVEGAKTIYVAETAASVSTVTWKQTLVIADTADAASTGLQGVYRHAQVTDSAGASDSVTYARGLVLTNAAEAASSLAGLRRALVASTETANATGTATATRHTGEALASAAAAGEVVSGVRHARATVADGADAVDSVRWPAQRQAVWANTMSGAAALWNRLRANSFAQIGDTVWRADEDGVGTFVESEGEVPAVVMWDKLDFELAHKKKLDVAYVFGQSTAPFVVRVSNGQGTFDYQTQLADEFDNVNHKARLGRGLVSRYYQFSLLNVNGKPFDGNAFSVDIGLSTRRR